MRSDSLVDLGYCPLPVKRGRKFCAVHGWQLPDKDGWRFAADGIGLNLVNLVMVDIDVENEDVVKAISAFVEEHYGQAPCRYRPNSSRVALLFRLAANEDDHFRYATGKYDGNRVEVKAGRGEFMFAFGTHPSGADLEWNVNSLPPIDQLPCLSEPDCAWLVGEVDAALEQRFGPPDEPARTVRDVSSEHDLRWDMFFDTPDGGGTLADLCAGPGDSQWVNLTPWRPLSDSMAGHLFWGEEVDGPVLFDFVTWTRHFLAASERTVGSEEDEALLLEAAGIEPLITPAERVERQLDGALDGLGGDGELDAAEQLNRLVYVVAEERIHVIDDPDALPVTKTALLGHLPNRDREDVFRDLPRAHQTAWDPSQPPRAMVRSRKGRVDFNTFALPEHPPLGGEVDTFYAFLKGFLPLAEDREVVLDWMAAKVQDPGERYFAVVLFGPQGSGKGLFGSVLRELWGSRYVNEANPRVLFNGQYDDPLESALYVICNETSSLMSRYNDKEGAYESLKRLLDPKAQTMTLNIKKGGMKVQKVCASFLFCTNNSDGLPLADDQRRFFVTETGPMLSPMAAKKLVRWMAEPKNLGALWRDLMARVIDRDMFRAPDSKAKKDMAEASRSDIDDLVDDFCEAVVSFGGAYMVAQAKNYAARMGHQGPEVKVFLHKLKVRSFRPFGRKKVKVGGNMFVLDVLRGSPVAADLDAEGDATFEAAKASARSVQVWLGGGVEEED